MSNFRTGGRRRMRGEKSAVFSSRAAAVSLFLLAFPLGSRAAEKQFTIGGATLSLQDVSSEVGVLFQSMRFNRAAHVWNVEVTVTNQSTQTRVGPLLLLIDSYSGTSGPQQADGFDDSVPAKAFYDLSASLTNGAFVPGDRTAPRTLTLGFTSGAPSLVAKVYMKPAGIGVPLGLTRSLNEVGQPLAGAQIEEIGPQGPRTNFTDSAYGVVTLGDAVGRYIWKFSAPDYLPAWVEGALDTNGVAMLPNPRLARRDTNSFTLTPIGGGQVTNRDASIALNFTPGSFAQNAAATLTPLTGQTLPAFLPSGWSPLQAFWLELTIEPSQPAAASLIPWGPINSNETAAWVRFDPANLQWNVVQTVSGNGANAVQVALQGSGAYALAIADAPPLAPPAPQVGQALASSQIALPDYAALKAAGSVQPPSSPASHVPELVTATANVTITNLSGNLPSGLLLQCRVSEDYRLRDGSHRLTPQYENSIVAYRRPGDGNPSALRASFPMRPLLLFGAEELDKATVAVDVLTPASFAGGVIDSSGGEIASGAVRVIAGVGDVTGPQAVQLRQLDPTNFTDLTTSNVMILQAFDLTMAGVALDHHLFAQFGPLPTNGLFVLAKVLFQNGIYGLQPLERFSSDANGQLASLEPATADRLPGLTGAGQYVLLHVQQPLALVTGTAQGSSGQTAGGLPVRVNNQPWLSFSDANGAFRLLAPTGSVQVVVTDPATGDTGQSAVVVSDPQTTVVANVATAATGPNVLTVTPAAGSTAVPQVTPIIVQFSKSINPGSLGAAGIQLLGTNGQPVAASLTLNLANTTATLLPTAQLDPSAQYTITISTNIADLQGRLLEGANLFAFTTASDNLNRGLGAQVISYEPTNGAARMEGTQGIADPNQPVILVNETTGRTSTVLSNPDGSFAGSIEASVDDTLSAVFVNQNGTRNTVPVSRQIFSDGSVGLFEGGGMIEADGENGPIQLVVEPGTVPNKSKFKLEAVTMADVLTAVSNTPPDGGKVLGGFRYSQSGDAPNKTPEVTFPVNVADLGLPPNVDPTNASYALAIPRTNDGVVTYQIIDRMTYSDGKLATHYFPFLGFAAGLAGAYGEFQFQQAAFDILVTPLLISSGTSITIAGRVSAAQINYNQNIVTNTQRFLPGAFVTARTRGDPRYPSPLQFGRLQSGAAYAVSGNDGGYSFLFPISAFSAGTVIIVGATHPGFPNASAVMQVPLPTSLDRLAISNTLAPVDLVFGTSVRPLGDLVPPVLSLDHAPSSPQPGQTATLRVVATDNASRPSISLKVDSAISLASGASIHLTDDIWQLQSQEDVGSYGQRNIYSVSVSNAVQVVFKVTATDAVGNTTSSSYPMLFGGSEPSATNNIPPADPNDTTGPTVRNTVPSAEATAVPLDHSIQITFDEPIDRTILEDPSPIQMSPATSSPTLSLSQDQTVLTLSFPDLKPATDYTLTIGSGVRDLVGNALDQDPVSAGDNAFTLHFRTAPLVAASLPGIELGGGAVIKGIYAYVLERKGALDGAVNVYDLSNPTNAVSVAQFSVPGYPRDLALIPNYSFKRRPNSDVETKDLLAVVGGNLSGSVGQYLWIIDISNPLSPQRVAAAQIDLSPSAAVTKVVWSPPVLGYLDIGDVPYVGMINLQSFILGELLRQLTPGTGVPWPIQGTSGLDLNGDGDYVDPGEELPYPQIKAGVLAGFVFAFTLNDTDQFINDFAMERGGNFVGVVLDSGHVLPGMTNAAPAYRTLYDYPLNLERQSASFEFTNGVPSRVRTLFRFPLSVSNVVSVVDLALVSVNGQNGVTNRLVVLDITDPTAPRELTEIPIPADNGTAVYSVEQRDDGLLMLALSRDVLLLDPSRFASPVGGNASTSSALVGVIPNAGVGAKSFAGTQAGLTVTSLGSLNQVLQSAPTLEVVSFPGLTPFAPATIASTNDASVAALLEQSIGREFLMPSRYRAEAGFADSTLSPPQAASHYYVLVHAPGSAGPTIELALESLNWAGHPLTKKGFLFPPVHALGTKALADLGQIPTDEDAPVRSCTAWRLSDNPASDYYNVYLSRPFALVYEEMSKDDLASVQSNLDRDILWSGAFLRVSLDPAMAENPVLGPFVDVVSTADGTIHPGVETVVQAFPADYIESPNPGPVNGWIMLPGTLNAVAAHSSELIINTVDMELPGRRLPVVFRRNYSGQGLYNGPFGRGWDFNYNQRVVEIPSGFASSLPLVVRDTPEDSELGESGGLLLYNGVGRVMIYNFAGTNAPPEVSSDPLVQHLGWITNTARFYLPPEGAFNLFFKFKDGRYARLEPDGMQYWYSPAGRLIKLYDRYETNSLEMNYNARGELIQILDELRRPLELGYWRLADDPLRRPLIDEMTSNPLIAGKICRLSDYSKRDLLFYYTDDGLLDRREGCDVETGVSNSFVGRQITRYLYSDSSDPTRSGKSLIGVVGGDEAGTPLISASALGQSGRDTVGQVNLGANAVSVTLGQPNTALALSGGGASTRVTTLDGGTTDYAFDQFGRATETIVKGSTGLAVTNHTEYYPNGLVKSVTYPEGNSIEYEYDSSNPALRSRANLIKVTRRPGPRVGPVLVATGEFDDWYNLPAGTKTDYDGNISTIELTPDHRTTAAITLGTDRETFEANEFGQLVRHTAIDAVETSQTYNGDGFLASRSIGSLTTTYSYANLTGGMSDPGLRGLPSIITDPNGNQTTRIYDERNQLVRESRGGVERTFAYDVAGRAIQTTATVDTNRVLVSQESYNQFGFLTARAVENVEVDGVPRNLTVRYIPDLFNRVKEIDWPSGQRDLIDYDPLGRVARYTIEGAYSESYGYDGNGNLTALTTGTSTQTLVHDGHDRLIRHITPMGTVIELGLDGNGNVLSKVVLDSQTNLLSAVTNTYDVLNRLRTTTRLRNDGSSTMRYDYDSTNRTMLMTDALGAVVTNSYDDVGRLERTVTPTLTSTFSYDSNGNKIEVETQEGGRNYVTRYGYDALDQLISITNNLGDVSQRVPGLDGRLLQSVDREGNHTTNSYRLTGELMATAAPTGVRIDYSYATNNQLDSIQNVTGGATRYSYDAQNRLLQATLPDDAPTTFTNFNELSVPTLVHMPRGISVESDFDLEGKLTNRVVSGFGPTRAETYQYDGMQRLVRATDPSGEMDFTYDLFGFIRETGQRYQFTTNAPPTNNLTFSVQQDADAGGFRSRVVYPYGSVTVTNRRDQVGRLLALLPTSGEPILKSTTYLGDSLVGQRMLGDDRILCQMQHDGLQRPIMRRYSRTSDGKVLTDVRYSYDREGAQLARQFVDRSGRADFFVYDGGYRLKRADLGVRPSLAGAEPARGFSGFNQPPGVPGAWAPGRFARTMTYSATDVLQGIALVNPDNLPTPLSASTFSTPDALSFVDNVDGFTRTRDEVGNVTRTRLAVRLPGQAQAEWVAANLSYNDLGQLVKIERDDGVVVLNEFGPDGLRIRRKITGDPMRCVPSDIAYLYDSGRLVEERDLSNGGAVLARYYYGDDGDELIAGDLAAPGTTNLSRYYFLTDTLKSVLAVADENGQVVERASYDAWGQPMLQARDESAPQVARVTLETNSLLIEFTEPVLPAFADPMPSTNLVVALKDPNLSFQVTAGGQSVSGRIRFEENLSGHLFGSVFRFIPDQPMSGTVQLNVDAAAVQDDWNNTNAPEVITLDLAGANPLYSGPAPGSTAPTELDRSSINSSLLFHGQYFDYDTGLLYCRARFYDPHTGMFLQRDPAGYTDGVDHYAGFAHNPINLRDPTGTATYETGQKWSAVGEEMVQEGIERGGVGGYAEMAFGIASEGGGAFLQLGTGAAEGVDLLHSERPGAWGVLDREHGAKLVLSDAQTALIAGSALYAAGSAAYNKVQGYQFGSSRTTGVVEESMVGEQNVRGALKSEGLGDDEIDGLFRTGPQVIKEQGAQESAEVWVRALKNQEARRAAINTRKVLGKPLPVKAKVHGEVVKVGMYDAMDVNLEILKENKLLTPGNQHVLLTDEQALELGYVPKEHALKTWDLTSDTDYAALIIDGETAGEAAGRRFQVIQNHNQAWAFRAAGGQGVPNVQAWHGMHINQADLVANGATVNGFKVDLAYAKKVGSPGDVFAVRFGADGNVAYRRVPAAEVRARMAERWNEFNFHLPTSWNK